MLIPHYRDVLSELSAAGAEYLLVGAFAMAAHELPRATSGIDLGIRPSPENAGRVWNALARFGAPMEKLSVEELADPDLFFQIGVAPVRIDILTRIDGVEFRRCVGGAGRQRVRRRRGAGPEPTAPVDQQARIGSPEGSCGRCVAGRGLP
jgi:hypothetical protein